jgi:hypothetical protein
MLRAEKVSNRFSYSCALNRIKRVQLGDFGPCNLILSWRIDLVKVCALNPITIAKLQEEIDCWDSMIMDSSRPLRRHLPTEAGLQ